VLHEVAPHAYGEQGVVAPDVQDPEPLHVDTAVWLPFAQEAAPQLVPAGQCSHAPLLHLPSVPQLEEAVAAQMPRGSTMPFTAVAQVPLAVPVNAAEHASQAALQAALQQNPSTQKPLWHWSGALHVPPFADFGAQVEPEHQSPETQSPSDVQLALQLEAPHT
jgi:hypothetical protein